MATAAIITPEIVMEVQPASPEPTPEDAQAALKFIESTLNLKLDSSKGLHVLLKDGVFLCRLMNAVSPNSIPKISTKPLPFLQMENINNFIHLCAACQLGLNELFEISDLYEGRAMNKVVQTLLALERQFKQGIRPAREPASALPKHLSTKSYSPRGTAHKLSAASSTAGSIATASVHADDIDPLDYALGAKQAQTEANQRAAIRFVEAVVGEQLPMRDMAESLRDGVILCRMMNILKPNSILSVNTGKSIPFLHMENIYNFLQAARAYGVKASEIFQTSDLYENRDMNQVVVTMAALERLAVQNGKIEPLKRAASIQFSDSKKANTSQMSINAAMESPESPTKLQPNAPSGSPKKSKPMKPAASYSDADGGLPKVAKLKMVHADTGEEIEYQFGDCIGRGHFGSVYRALNLSAGELVAIKRMSLDNPKDDLKSMMKEVDLLKSLSHPNILGFHGVVKQESHLYIILEFVEGGSLYHVMKQFGVFPEKLALAYTVGILHGLEYLHDRQIIHCDLKAANVLCTKTGTIKLGDFGVSKEFSFDQIDTSVAGTPNWMAPEIIELKGATTASDLWSLGCTVIEMLTGKPPYSECNPMTTLFRIVEDDMPPLPTGLSIELGDFLSKCFQKDPSQRPPAKQLLDHVWLTRRSKFSTGGTTGYPTSSSVDLPELSKSMNELDLAPVGNNNKGVALGVPMSIEVSASTSALSSLSSGGGSKQKNAKLRKKRPTMSSQTQVQATTSGSNSGCLLM